MNKNPPKKFKTLHNFFTTESSDSIPLIQNTITITSETISPVPDGSETIGMNLTVFLLNTYIFYAFSYFMFT